MERRTSGFSLVELLVVIGIVGILIALLLPALAGAQRQAKWVACQSNLRQIGQAFKSYEVENGGWIFPVTEKPGNPDEAVGLGLNMAPHQRWPMKVFKFAAPAPTYDMPYDRMNYLQPQYDPAPWSPPVILCPADVEPLMSHSYLLNNHLASNKVKAERARFGSRTASEVIVAGEKVSTSPDYLMEAGDFATAVEKFRHGGRLGSNYLYLDGHVAVANRNEAQVGMDPWDVVAK